MQRSFLVLLFMLACFPLWGQNELLPDVDTCLWLRNITIEGKRKTKDAIILRELSVKPGTCIGRENASALEERNKKRLYNLGLFTEVRIISDSAGADSLDWHISVTDRFPIFPEANVEFADRNFNVWWKEQHLDWRRINLGLTLNHNNFRGNRELISVTGQVGYTQKAGFTYSRPFADKQQKQGYGFSFFGLQNREIAYKTENNKLLFERDENHFMLRRFDVSAWYTYRPKYAIIHRLQLAFQHYWINNDIVALNPNYLGNSQNEENILSFQYRFEYNHVDNWNYPLTGNRFIGYFDEQFMLRNKNFLSSFHLQADQYFNPAKNWYAALIFRGRTSFPQRQAYIFQQNLGYDFDVIRGFEYYVMDGSSFALLRADIKRTLINKQIRLPVRYLEVVPIRVYAKLYGDAGISYNKFPQADLLNNKGLFSYGLGVDIVTLYDIKVRVEYTFNSLHEKGLFLHKSGE